MKDFNEYVKKGIVKKQRPDISRANSLLDESKISYKILKEFIEKINLTDENANYIIKNSYDIIMEIIRAKMLLHGLNASGKGAHEAEVSYLRTLNFKETQINFINQLRYFRNGILYYGKKFDKEYSEKVVKLLELVYNKLLETNQ
jgi:hypothetical protein